MISLEDFEERLRASVAAGKLTEGQAGVEADRRRAWLNAQQAGIFQTTSGPGTELKALLKTIGITSSPTCSCNKRARVMDEKGCDWCEEHIDEIDGWLAEEAKKRKLPYISLAGKTLIRLAIRRARKKGNSR
jgi:hypothetical protein